MSWVATAVIGGAIIGGVASNKASKRAAEGQEQALASSGAAISQARGEVKDAFGQAELLQNQGFASALESLKMGAGRQIDPLQQGNLQAQNTLIGGLQQQQNALLGNAPVDLSGFQPQSISLAGLLPPPPIAPQATPPVTPSLLPPNIATPQINQGVLPQQLVGGIPNISNLTQAQIEELERNFGEFSDD